MFDVGVEGGWEACVDVFWEREVREPVGAGEVECWSGGGYW